MIKNLINKRLGGEVKRFHTKPMIKEHLVSSHSWGVALCVQVICPDCSKALILAALEHDVHEHITGDMNAVTKWEFPSLAAALSEVEKEVNAQLDIPMFNLTPFEKQVLKTADLGDLVLCCLLEYKLGNLDALNTVKRGLDYLGDYCSNMGTRDFYNALEDHVISEVGLDTYNEI